MALVSALFSVYDKIQYSFFRLMNFSGARLTLQLLLREKILATSYVTFGQIEVTTRSEFEYTPQTGPQQQSPIIIHECSVEIGFKLLITQP